MKNLTNIITASKDVKKEYKKKLLRRTRRFFLLRGLLPGKDFLSASCTFLLERSHIVMNCAQTSAAIICHTSGARLCLRHTLFRIFTAQNASSSVVTPLTLIVPQ